jgi:predicted SAM-dependent methyltransferase
MSLTVQAGATLTFERFWGWLRRHPNCILRAGTPDSWLYDQDDLHWHLDEGPERHPTVQLIRGKQVIAEIALDVRDVVFVQATLDSEEDGERRFLFEVVGGDRAEPYPVDHFRGAHGCEEEPHRAALKH